MTTRLAAVALLGLCAAAAARAGSEYVVEQLVISVNGAADGSGERVGSIRSGDRVEVLERQGEQVHVRLAGGREGWVRGSYLSAEPPLRAQLAERDAQLASLTQQLAQLRTELDAARAAAAGPLTKAAPPPGDAAGSDSPPGHGGLAWRIGALLLTLLAGFALGWRVLDRRIRRKYGGLRIY
ncbi:MAG TPA: TIGR04211 family SH3 domain-containing protein [Steroidobacteraceae bacterium]|nr:TIGR04211 family SH3 domain-containing protein [Steroidobacteraceae bacterium]